MSKHFVQLFDQDRCASARAPQPSRRIIAEARDEIVLTFTGSVAPVMVELRKERSVVRAKFERVFGDHWSATVDARELVGAFATAEWRVAVVFDAKKINTTWDAGYRTQYVVEDSATVVIDELDLRLVLVGARRQSLVFLATTPTLVVSGAGVLVTLFGGELVSPAIRVAGASLAVPAIALWIALWAVDSSSGASLFRLLATLLTSLVVSVSGGLVLSETTLVRVLDRPTGWCANVGLRCSLGVVFAFETPEISRRGEFHGRRVLWYETVYD